MGYAFEFQGKAFTPEGAAQIANVEAHNKALEQKELETWRQAPGRFVAYVTHGRLTTFLGTELGRVTVTRKWHRWSRHGMRSTMEAIRVDGNNGATYFGQYGSDWSQLVRLRKSARQ